MTGYRPDAAPGELRWQALGATDAERAAYDVGYEEGGNSRDQDWSEAFEDEGLTVWRDEDGGLSPARVASWIALRFAEESRGADQ